MVALDAGGGGAQHYAGAFGPCQHDGHGAGVVAGRGVLLLVAGLVFFVDDDESEFLKGQEDGGAGAEDDIVGVAGELFLPYLDALGVGVA